MGIDVIARTTVARPAGEVAVWVMDPANDLRWIRALSASEKLTEGPPATGMRVRRTAKMLGRPMRYTTEVVELEPRRLVMRTVEGPFPMVVTYSFQDAGEGVTLVSVRNEGGAGLVFTLLQPLIGWMVNSRVKGDLALMKRVLEATPT